MIYSKTCEYALRALVYLAQKNTEGLTMIPEISRESGVPGPYVAKIFRDLVGQNILESRKGPRGGFRFKLDPGKITLMQVVEAVDDGSRMNACAMGLDECSAANACPLHHVWTVAKKKIITLLEKETLRSVKKKVSLKSYRAVQRSQLNTNMCSVVGGLD